MIKLLLADDHRIIREGLRLILETVEDFNIVGEASNGEEALILCRELNPDVVLMDLRMPKMDGLEAIEKIISIKPDTAIIVLTTFNEDELMVRSLRLGARGYLLKDTDRESLFRAIRSAYRGDMFLKSEIFSQLLTTKQSDSSKTGHYPLDLTDREYEVLNSIAQGNRSKEIASVLGISERTVKAHLGSIYAKLGVDSRAGAVAVAAQKGLIHNNKIDLNTTYDK